MKTPSRAIGSRLLWLSILVFQLFPPTAQAQLPVIQLRGLFPPGGQAGTETTIQIVDGTDREELSGLLFSHPGIELLETPDPLSNPSSFRVKITEDVPAGYHSVRMQGRFGVSNPRMFHVDSLPVQVIEESAWKEGKPVTIPLDSVVYSRCESGRDIDEFALSLESGQSVEVRVDCRDLDSPLQPVLEVYHPNGRRIRFGRQVRQNDPAVQFTADVAGEYRLRVYDFLFESSGNHTYRLVASSRSIPEQVRPPVAVGAENPVYHTPGSDRQLPAEILDDQPNPVLAGFVNPRELLIPRETVRFRLENNDTFLKSLPRSAYEPVTEVEPNDETAAANQLSVPAEMTGTFGEAYDVDCYRFPVKKGESLWIQIFAQRDGAMLDPFLQIEHVTKDANGKETVKAVNVPDDDGTNLLPNVFDTLTDDVNVAVTAPADGEYRLTVRNRYAVQEDQLQQPYRLRVSPPAPDFRLFAIPQPHVIGNVTVDTPSGCVARQGETVSLQLLVERIHGFNQGILVESRQALEGLAIPPLFIPPGSNQATLVIYTKPDTPPGPHHLQLTARPCGDPSKPAETSSDLVHTPVPVTVTWKASATLPAMSRQDHQLLVSVIDEKAGVAPVAPEQTLAMDVSQSQVLWHPLEIQRPSGHQGKVTLAATGLDKNAKIAVEVPEIAEKATTSPVRLQMQADAREGWHTVMIQGETTLNYVRNPQLLAQAENKQKTAAAKLEEAKKKQTDLEAAVKTSEKDVTTKEGERKRIADEIKKLEMAIQSREKAITEKKTQVEAEQDEEAKKTLSEALEKDQKEQAAAQTKLADLKKSETEAAKELEAARKTLETKKKEREAVVASVAPLQKELSDAQKNLEQVKKSQAPKQLKQIQLLDRIVLRVHKAPLKMAVKPGDKLSLKPGASTQVDVEISREGEQKFPVELTATLPPGTGGVSWEPVKVAPDQSKATLTLTAAQDSKPIEITNATIRCVAELPERKLAVDAPVAIKVE